VLLPGVIFWKDQFHDVGDPIEVSLNLTGNDNEPDVIFDVNDAIKELGRFGCRITIPEPPLPPVVTESLPPPPPPVFAVPLLAADLRSAETGAAGFVSVYLATLLQCSAFDCVGGDWAFAVRGFLLAGSGTGVVDPYLGAAPPSSWNSATDVGRDAGYVSRDWRLRVDGVSPVSAHHRHRAAYQGAVGGGDGNHRVDHLRRADSLQRASGI